MQQQMKDTGIEWLGEIPAHWEVKPLKKVFNILTGFTPPTTDQSNYDGEIPWITIADLTDGEFLHTKTKLAKKGIIGKQPAKKGSLLYSFKLSIGKVAILTRDAFTNEAIASFEFRPSVLGSMKYYYYGIAELLHFAANENIYMGQNYIIKIR